VSLLIGKNPTVTDRRESRLIQLAALFLFIFSISLSLAPAARLHTWQVDYRWNHWIGFAVWFAAILFTHYQLIRSLPDRDPFIFPVMALLAGWGLLAIWRLDSVMGARQTIWLVVSMAFFTAGLRIPGLLDWLRRYKYMWLTGGMLLMVLTFIIGTYPGGEGPRLWLGCCGLYLQPSEPLKLLLVIYLSAYLADRIPLAFNMAQLLPPTLIMIGSALALLIAQRDLGTASLFIIIYSVVLYLASRRKRILVISLLVLGVSAVVGYILFDVVRIRVDAWLNPWLDPSGRSYQIVQSLLAVASGGLVGRGPGLGSPGVVPLAHSDFIFASIAEETGLLGIYALLGLYALLVSRGFRASLHAVNNYQRYLSAGITVYIVTQAILIIGGNLRLLPLTGVTLPYVSYGGSSLLTASMAGLLLLIISSRGEKETAPLDQTIPYQLTSGGLLLGLLALALAAGWWASVRSDNLLARTDNPRRGISDRYVKRGSLLDRNNQPVVSTTGRPGEYRRLYEYPPLGPITGYNNPLYGLAGLEAGLDGYLRGLKGNPKSAVLTEYILTGQPPPGLDVRLSLDLKLQEKADQLLENHQGAAVVVDAQTGEILAMASHPYFDPNKLESIWPDLVQSPGSPLLNRAAMGQYPPGAALGPFLLAYLQDKGLFDSISKKFVENPALTGDCALPVDEPFTAGELVSAGCQKFYEALIQEISPTDRNELAVQLGFQDAPALPLETSANTDLSNLTASPLQMALAAAAITNQGIRPVPQIALSVITPEQGWQVFPKAPPQGPIFGTGAIFALKQLAAGKPSGWEATAVNQGAENSQSWFIGGKDANSLQAESAGRNLAVAVVLEEDDPEQAEAIGRALLDSASQLDVPAP
jgi:cell division protein FtsW (lipid II flippase)